MQPNRAFEENGCGQPTLFESRCDEESGVLDNPAKSGKVLLTEVIRLVGTHPIHRAPVKINKMCRAFFGSNAINTHTTPLGSSEHVSGC